MTMARQFHPRLEALEAREMLTVTIDLPVMNAGFETGTLDNWEVKTWRKAGNPQVVTPLNGSTFEGSSMLKGMGGKGGKWAGVSQRLDLTALADEIDDGDAILTFGGQGRGGGRRKQFARLEMVFRDEVGNAMGSLQVSNKAWSKRAWTELVIDAAVPTGAREVELRGVFRRPGNAIGKGKGCLDGLAAELTYQEDVVPEPLPVLMVIANVDFYYREYAEPRQELEAAGFDVHVAAATLALSTPHPGSGQGADGGLVQPDLTLAEVDPANYSAIVFVGGWGSSSYQYDFPGTYANPTYNGHVATKEIVNDLINDFIAQDKYVTAICHGVTVLAWARVDGVSPIAGRTVSTHDLAPATDVGDGTIQWHIETNGGTMFDLMSLGDPTTAADDVWVDGKIITAQNYDSARYFGQVLAAELAAS